MRCPTPDKRSYRSRLVALREAYYKAWWYGNHQEPYRCRCDRWHLTSKSTRKEVHYA